MKRVCGGEPASKRLAAGLSEAEATAARKLELELVFAKCVEQTSHHCLALL